jgi:sugar phosphate isomerase/epimerase
MLKFLGDVDMPQTVRANCDISHLYLMQQPPEAIERLGDRIAHVHLSDCNGHVHGDLPPGRGVVPIFDYLRALHAIGYDQTVSIELEYSPEPDYIMQWVDLSYRVTANMMRDLGCRP